jgi:hypothetical protein
MIPQWLAKKRHQTCEKCELVKTCLDKHRILEQNPVCQLRKIPSLKDEIIWAQAWPESAPAVSNCCGNALNY